MPLHPLCRSDVPTGDPRLPNNCGEGLDRQTTIGETVEAITGANF